MILETQQNWFHNFWTTTQFILIFKFVPETKLAKCFRKLKGPVATYSAQRWTRPSEAHGGELVWPASAHRVRGPAAQGPPRQVALAGQVRPKQRGRERGPTSRPRRG